MAWKNDNKEFTIEIVPNFDFIIEEGANTSINVRKVSWNGRPPKIDIRKWAYQDGQERAMKGVSLTDEGTNELSNVLVEQGYGDTKRIIAAIKQRKDYDNSINQSPQTNEHEEEDDSEEYYDPSELFGGDY